MPHLMNRRYAQIAIRGRPAGHGPVQHDQTVHFWVAVHVIGEGGPARNASRRSGCVEIQTPRWIDLLVQLFALTLCRRHVSHREECGIVDLGHVVFVIGEPHRRG